MIHGIQRVINVRASGMKPKLVWLWVGYEFQAKGFDLALEAPRVSEDFRPLVGLSVVIRARQSSAALFAMWEELKQVCGSLTLSVESWDDDTSGGSVLIWDKKHGQRTLEETCKS